jgi:tRNA threonylcarbamoyladenosine biosynthesis protein TsaB
MDGFLILSVETATSCGSVSLTRGGKKDFHLLGECTSQPDITHSRHLFGSIDWLMKSAEIKWDDLDAIGISMGPGSFTGLRIGMAAAKSFAMAATIPLVGVPTLDALALCSGVKNSLLCCLLDARKQEVYGAFYRTDETGWPSRIIDPVAMRPADILQDVDEPVVLVGPGAQVYRGIFQGSDYVYLPADFRGLPRAVNVGIMAAEKLKLGKTLDPVTAGPMYVRASEAEVNLKRKKMVTDTASSRDNDCPHSGL